METLINLAILALALIGALYAIGLIIIALIGPPIVKDEDSLYCDCERCND